ncbi:MAG: hypothetical protein ACU0GG_21855 [Paracoccaceae bacterium]
MSSPMGDAGPARSFESRLNRVADARAPHEANKPEVSVLPDWKQDVAHKFGLPIALVFGAMAVFAVRLAQFHINGTALVSSTPDMTMAIEAGVVILLSVIVMLMMPMQSALVKLGYLVGVGVGLVAMHNAVHMVPAVFSLAFSQGWTESVVAVTEPNSIYFLGESIVVAPELVAEDEAPVKPTVLRLD